MKQAGLATTGFVHVTKRTRKWVFPTEMNLLVPWTELVGIVEPVAPTIGRKGGHPVFAVKTMLRTHFLQLWFRLSDPGMDEAMHDVSLHCEFAHLNPCATRLPMNPPF